MMNRLNELLHAHSVLQQRTADLVSVPKARHMQVE